MDIVLPKRDNAKALLCCSGHQLHLNILPWHMGHSSHPSARRRTLQSFLVLYTILPVCTMRRGPSPPSVAPSGIPAFQVSYTCLRHTACLLHSIVTGFSPPGIVDQKIEVVVILHPRKCKRGVEKAPIFLTLLWRPFCTVQESPPAGKNKPHSKQPPPPFLTPFLIF